ncbi:sensor domain-containing protein [Microbacterium sp. X-17]|uniref:sensor histidine kinase n=1 Tax=Microbacterium sp. X-17 TaxID=3144404 RepID=UPI0031F5CF68
MTTIAAPLPRATFWREYAQLWRRVPGNAVYPIAAFVLAMLSLSVLASLFFTGIGLLVLVIGLPLVVGAMLVARGFAIADRFLLRLTGLPAIPEPEWNHDTPGRTGFWAVLTRPLRTAHSWTALVHGMLVAPVVSTVSFAIAVTWLSISLGGWTYWFWGGFIPRGNGGAWGRYVADAVPWVFGGWSSWNVEVVLYLIAGVLFGFTLPWVLGGLAAGQHAIARGMLGRWESDDLAVEVRAEAAARTAAVRAEERELRRLERDIHDGPQQRLVRLQLDLAALERRAAAGDADAAAELAAEARVHAAAALDELRALSAGVAPPLLQDRGLTAALEALALASAVPVRCELAPGLDAGVGSEVARTVYFTVAELLTNVTKHAGARGVTLRAGVVQPAPGEAPVLEVVVADDGHGGARLVSGHGLEGLTERVRGLRGTLEAHSPVGGPTTVQVRIPLPSAESGA